LIVLASAVLVTVLDQVYSIATGEVFSIGGMRTSMVAGLLLVAGLGLCAYRFKRQ
jgi:hypothetical protein